MPARTLGSGRRSPRWPRPALSGSSSGCSKDRQERAASHIQNVEALARAIIEKPDDDALRLVYADLLSAQGDPRGEFIVLQLARGEASEKGARRARALLAQHRDRWLGSVDRVATVTFSRGFPFALALRSHSTAPEKVWRSALTADCLSTIEILEKGRGSAADLAGFMLSPRMTNLRCTDVPPGEGLRRLCEGPVRRIERLVLLWPPARDELSLLSRTGALPGLKWLTICGVPSPWARVLPHSTVGAIVKRLVGSGVLRRIEGLALRSPTPGTLETVREQLRDAGHAIEVRVDRQRRPPGVL